MRSTWQVGEAAEKEVLPMRQVREAAKKDTVPSLVFSLVDHIQGSDCQCCS